MWVLIGLILDLPFDSIAIIVVAELDFFFFFSFCWGAFSMALLVAIDAYLGDILFLSAWIPYYAF